jgi:hypothetical protein
MCDSYKIDETKTNIEILKQFEIYSNDLNFEYDEQVSILKNSVLNYINIYNTLRNENEIIDKNKLINNFINALNVDDIDVNIRINELKYMEKLSIENFRHDFLAQEIRANLYEQSSISKLTHFWDKQLRNVSTFVIDIFHVCMYVFLYLSLYTFIYVCIH